MFASLMVTPCRRWRAAGPLRHCRGVAGPSGLVNAGATGRPARAGAGFGLSGVPRGAHTDRADRHGNEGAAVEQTPGEDPRVGEGDDVVAAAVLVADDHGRPPRICARVARGPGR